MSYCRNGVQRLKSPKVEMPKVRNNILEMSKSRKVDMIEKNVYKSKTYDQKVRMSNYNVHIIPKSPEVKVTENKHFGSLGTKCQKVEMIFYKIRKG